VSFEGGGSLPRTLRTRGDTGGEEPVFFADGQSGHQDLETGAGKSIGDNWGKKEDFPIVATTYRVVEQWQAGGMSRWLEWLTECQPEMFVEMSKELAKELRIDNRVGTIDPGKDADLVIWNHHPLSVYAVAQKTFIDASEKFHSYSPYP
jgi:predicted molibdopterin-dependent oxidoreductase YjgC